MNVDAPPKVPPCTLPRLSLMLGGAASGKSVFAENLVAGCGLSPVHIATAEVWDDEMAAKVATHRARRGPEWRSIEEPRDLPAALRQIAPGEAALIDCATLWLSNLLLAEAELEEAEAALFAALDTCAGPVVVVSNEVGLGIVPDNALARRFRYAQGGLNLRLAARADLVANFIAGLPMVLKGVMP